MTVKELIETLEKMPKDIDVCVLWEGGISSNVCFVWVANCGVVVLADENEYTTDTRDFPVGFVGNRYETPQHPKKD